MRAHDALEFVNNSSFADSFGESVVRGLQARQRRLENSLYLWERDDRHALRRHRPRFTATTRQRNYLARIAQSRRIESRAHAHHRVHVIVGKNQPQVTALVQAYSVLAGNRAAGAHAGFHDLASGLPHALKIVAAAQVKTDQGMQVAVAGMKDVRELQIILFRDAIGFGEHLGQTRARHDCILNHDIGTKPAHRAEGAFARRPKLLSFVFVGGATNRTRPMIKQNRFCFLGIVVDARFYTIEFDQ